MSTDAATTASQATPVTPGLLGISHLGLTVTDASAAQHFWTSVMGFTALFQGDGYFMAIEPSAALAIGVTTHEHTAGGAFDEKRVGLDHLALAVADVPTLHQWEQRLTAADVPHSTISTSDSGYHLNLRAPENFPVELFVLTDEGAAEMGITLDGPPAAGTHPVVRTAPSNGAG